MQTVGNDQTDTLAGRVEAGSPFTGEFTFRADTSDAEADPAIGIYQSESPTGMSLSVGTLSTMARADGLRIRVRNNNGNEEDDYEVIHLPPPPAVDGIGIDEMRLFLRTRDTSLFSSDALPTTLPNPAQDRDVHGVLELSLSSAFVFGVVDWLDVVRIDTDSDGVADEDDVCPFAFDPDQRDTDGDGVGDACEPACEFSIGRRRFAFLPRAASSASSSRHRRRSAHGRRSAHPRGSRRSTIPRAPDPPRFDSAPPPSTGRLAEPR